MARYAANTEVPADRSRAEIEKTLQRYGATSFAYGWTEGKAMIEFAMDGRRVRFVLPMPERNDRAFTLTPTGKTKSDTAAQASWEQATRQRWRALNLVVKAKLEAVESEITTFEDEFMAHIVLPNGSTVGQFMKPQIEEAYTNAVMPSMLALGAGT